MKKILSVLVCVCLLLSAMVITASAADTTATISFADKANRTSYSSSKQVWEQNGITVTNDKSSSTSPVGDYADPGRFYKSSKTTIEYPGMTKIEIDTADIEAKYRAWDTSFTDNNATASATASVTTITFATPVDSFVFASMAAQCRANSITVYATVADPDPDPDPDPEPDPEPTCEHTVTSCEPNGNETHKVVCDACTETITPAVDCTDADVNGKCDVCEGDVEIPVQYPAADSTLSIADAAALGDAMTHNTTTDGKYYVEGTIKSIASTMWGNMTIEDAEGNTLYIYGTYSEDGKTRYDALETKPVVGDTVKLYGVIGNYNGAQMKSAWIIEHTPATTPDDGEDDGDDTPVVEDPAADSVLTIEEALALGASKDHNTYTENKYYVTGEVVEYYTNYETYGNMYIEDAEGNRILIYGIYSEDGEIRYDALEDKPEIGDTITVYGIIGQYSGNAQMKNGWLKAAPVVDDGNDDVTPPAGDDDADNNDADNNDADNNDADNNDGTTGGTTGGTTTDKDNANTDNSTTSPDTGDAMGAVVALAMVAGAALVFVNKKR